MVDLKAHHEGWARKATQEVLELERAVEVTFLRISFTNSVRVTNASGMCQGLIRVFSTLKNSFNNLPSIVFTTHKSKM